MYIDDCVDCKIITGPIDSSIFIRTCKNCTVSTIARQVRFRDSENIKIFTYCPSDPAVESSFNISFAPYNVFFPYLKELFVKGKFVQNEPNHIKTPYDFTGDKVYANGAKHFFLMPEEEFYIEEIPDGDAPCEEMFDGYSQQEPFVSRKRAEKNTNVNDEFRMEDNTNSNNIVNHFFSSEDQNKQMLIIEDNNVQSSSHGKNINELIGNEGFEFSSNVPLSVPIDKNNIDDNDNDNDLEEQTRLMERQKENEERARKIREKIDLELKQKNQLREKAIEYLNNFNIASSKKIEENKRNNQFNETQWKNEIKDMSSLEKSTVNPWDRVCKMVNLKESDYKGTKNVSRMRACLISCKGDYNNK